MYSIQPQTTKELVINWHLTEACNYSCKYCYAHWHKLEQQRDIIHDEMRVKALLTELYKYFSPEKQSNSLQKSMRWNSVRLNIVGGEPLLYDQKVLAAITFAREIGMDVSLITNGSRLSVPLMQNLAPHLSLFGLSLDSDKSITNGLIGRVDCKGRLLSVDDTCSILAVGRQINPLMKLKINTVVNSVNCGEDMTTLIHAFMPDRWKVFRMLPVLNNNLAVSQSDFDGFVSRHRLLDNIMCVEDHAEMTESYIMIDPIGRFFQNSTTTGESGYCYSPSILSIGAEKAFFSLNFSPDKFLARYNQDKAEVLL